MTFIFPLVFFSTGLYMAAFKKQKGGRALAVMGGLMLLLMGTRYVNQARNHLFLSNLSAAEVAQVQVGRSIIDDADDIELIVAALNDKSWFSSNHGGWAETVPLVILMQDGRERRFRAGYYLRQEGAVIEFSREWLGGRWRDGYAFSEKLPAVLKEIGAVLPSDNRAR